MRTTLPLASVAAVVAVLSLTACGGSDEPAATGVAALEAGTCFDPTAKDADIDYPTKITTVDCGDSHDYEVLSNDDLGDKDAAFPGATQSKAKAACQDVYKSYVGAYDTETKGLFLGFVYPTEKEWGEGKRAVICFAAAVDDDGLVPRKGSVKGAGAGEGASDAT